PSPAISSVFLATCLTSSAPIFSHGSSSSISLAMDTPSFVIVGAPHFFSRTTLRPLGPSATLTATASWFIPRSRARRASSSKAIILGIVRLPPLFGWLAWELVSGLAIPVVSTQDVRVLSLSAITPLGPKSSLEGAPDAGRCCRIRRVRRAGCDRSPGGAAQRRGHGRARPDGGPGRPRRGGRGHRLPRPGRPDRRAARPGGDRPAGGPGRRLERPRHPWRVGRGRAGGGAGGGRPPPPGPGP